MKIIEDFTNINEIIKEEKIDICIISYGGSLSNTFTDILEKNNYNIRTKTYKKILCHCPEVINIDIPIIYIYRNPIYAFISCKRRKYIYKANIKKLNNNTNINISDENLFKAMLSQFCKYYEAAKINDNILFIKSEELFKPTIVDKLKKFLKNDNLKYFPLKFKKPKSNYNKLVKKNMKLFLKYKKMIDFINNCF